MAKQNRLLRSNTLSQTYAVCMTKSLSKTIREKSELYRMTRSSFIRSVLEQVDDSNLWEELLGPV